MPTVTKRTPETNEFFVVTDSYDFLTDNRPLGNLLEGMLELDAEMDYRQKTFYCADSVSEDPGVSDVGTKYLIREGGTGVFSGKDGQIAVYVSPATYTFIIPTDGDVAFVWSNGQQYFRVPEDWRGSIQYPFEATGWQRVNWPGQFDTLSVTVSNVTSSEVTPVTRNQVISIAPTATSGKTIVLPDNVGTVIMVNHSPYTAAVTATGGMINGEASYTLRSNGFAMFILVYTGKWYCIDNGTPVAETI